MGIPLGQQRWLFAQYGNRFCSLTETARLRDIDILLAMDRLPPEILLTNAVLLGQEISILVNTIFDRNNNL